MTSIRIVNESTNYQLPDTILDAMVDAIDVGLHQVARAWSDYVLHITASAHSQGWRVVLLDNPDEANALGYHDVGPDGLPYARVFLDPIFDHDGTWLEGPLSVSSVVSHEVFEMSGDPAANVWANDADGVLYARELCDAVEADAWDVNAVSVSNFLLPDYFNPWSDGPYDYCGTIDKPFGLAPGGYAIYEDVGQVGQVFGQLFAGDYPSWRRALKGEGSRTYARERGA